MVEAADGRGGGSSGYGADAGGFRSNAQGKWRENGSTAKNRIELAAGSEEKRRKSEVRACGHTGGTGEAGWWATLVRLCRASLNHSALN